MMQKVVNKEELYKQIESLLKDFEIIGTKEISNKGIFYETLRDTKDLYLGDAFAVEPVKKFFLCPSEWIFREKYECQKNILENSSLDERKRIIIGVRPCEARGLTLLDKVFDSNFKDNLYINNRRRTIVIGLACSKSDQNCFCTSMGGLPVESRGTDVLLFNSERGFIVDIISDKGKEIFGSLGEALDEKKLKSWQLDKEQMKDSLKKKINPPESLDKIFESDYWKEVSQSCLSCGICTYLCPTCHCFDLVDEERKRLRCYDGCSFPDFTLEASGENPRPTKKERYRQKVYHKFDYFKKNFGENLCVGCGRCIRHCPVKIDIADIVDKVPVITKE